MSDITFENISKQFAGMPRPAVANVSLAIPSAAFVVLLGPSGCGKTTLMKMVNRLYEPDSGRIYLSGKAIDELDPIVLRRQIGYVIQQIGLFPHMTVRQNVGIVPDLLDWDEARIDRRVDELLDLVHLPPAIYRDRYPAQMSGGQQQRVGVARALASDPEVILMDEPFGAIDAITRGDLQDELLRLQRQLKKTILFVTHDVDEALRLADKIVVMRDGAVVQFDTPLQILQNPVDQFVEQLVGSRDIVRQLGLLRVESAMLPLPATFNDNGQPRIEHDASLRDALSRFLEPDVRRLVVVEEQQPVGILEFNELRRLS